MKQRSGLVLILLSAMSITCYAGPAATAETEVRKTLSDFIQAFDNLGWDRFCAAFSDDATVFYPREFPNRANGRQEYERTFQKVSIAFEQAEPRGLTWTSSREIYAFKSRGT